jgi:hypothetical protein
MWDWRVVMQIWCTGLHTEKCRCRFGHHNGSSSFPEDRSSGEPISATPTQAIAVLHSPDAGNVIPYKFAIALVKNAMDNGMELCVRCKVTGVKRVGGSSFLFNMTAQH